MEGGLRREIGERERWENDAEREEEVNIKIAQGEKLGKGKEREGKMQGGRERATNGYRIRMIRGSKL